jgi:hypothetical protein
MKGLVEGPVFLTQEEYDSAKVTVSKAGTRNQMINSKIIYVLWQKFFGIRKAPNGCGACMRTDLTNFASAWRIKEEQGLIEIEKNKENTDV